MAIVKRLFESRRAGYYEGARVSAHTDVTDPPQPEYHAL